MANPRGTVEPICKILGLTEAESALMSEWFPAPHDHDNIKMIEAGIKVWRARHMLKNGFGI